MELDIRILMKLSEHRLDGLVEGAVRMGIEHQSEVGLLSPGPAVDHAIQVLLLDRGRRL